MTSPVQRQRALITACGNILQHPGLKVCLLSRHCSSIASKKNISKTIHRLVRYVSRDAPRLQGTQLLEHPLTQTERFSGDVDPLEKLPSVTRVLGATKPVESEIALLAWKRKMITKMGEARFNAMQAATLQAGTQCHAAIERRLCGEEDIVVDRSCARLWESVQPVLGHVDSVHVVERKYTHPYLKYYGFVDCVAKYKGDFCSIDWKTSSKPRYTLNECYDDPLQVAAYAGAVNCSLPPDQQILHGLVVKIYHDGKPATAFSMNNLTLEYFWRKWLRRLEAYNIMEERAKKREVSAKEQSDPAKITS